MNIFYTFITINISKLHVWFVICIAKNFIWKTSTLNFNFNFKDAFLNMLKFVLPQIPDFQIVVGQILSDPNIYK